MKTTQETNTNTEIGLGFGIVTMVIIVTMILFLMSILLQQNKITLIVNNITEFEIYKTHLIDIVELTHLILTGLTVLTFVIFLLDTRLAPVFYFFVLLFLFIINNSNTTLHIVKKELTSKEINEGIIIGNTPKFLAYSLKLYNEIKQ